MDAEFFSIVIIHGNYHSYYSGIICETSEVIIRNLKIIIIIINK